MSAALDFDNWDEISKRRGYRPEFLAYVSEDRQRQRAEELAAKRHAEAMAKLRRVPKWAFGIITETLETYGVLLHEFLSDCRPVNVVRARHHVYYRIKEAKPTLSSPQIAGWFGRDHTTILHGLACHARRNGLPGLSRYNLDAAMVRNRLASRVGRTPKRAMKAA